MSKRFAALLYVLAISASTLPALADEVLIPASPASPTPVAQEQSTPQATPAPAQPETQAAAVPQEPAQGAADGTSVAQAGASDAASKDSDKKDSDKKDKGAASASSTGFGKRLVSFTTGTIVGIPVATVRKTIQDTKSGTHDITGDNKWLKILLWAPGMTMSVPFACISGPAEGVYFGTRNSWKHAGDEPFSKDSFSLGDMP